MADTIVSTNENLDRMRGRLGEKTEELERLGNAIIKTEEHDGEKKDVVDADAVKDYRAVLKDATELREAVEAMEAGLGIKNWADAPRGTSTAEMVEAIRAQVKDELGQQQGPRGNRSISGMFIESKCAEEFKANGGKGTTSWEFEGGGFTDGVARDERKDIYTASAPTYTSLGFGTIDHDPTLPQVQRVTRVRDLFPARPTSGNLIQFFRATGWAGIASANVGLGGPTSVGERNGSVFMLKPGPAGLTWDSVTAAVKTLAWWESAHRNVLEDEPQLQSTIQDELLYGLRLFEDFQILSGDGNGDNLAGILGTPGVQHYAMGGSPEQQADAIRKGMTLAFLSYFEPTGVVVHPKNWETIELIKDNQYRYIVAGSVALGAQPTVWRLPVVQTPAIPQGTALVGAFGIGAQLYDRQVANIRLSENVSDDFLRNAIRVLAEERLALAVKRPESFVRVTGL
jgi:hypothetical protein